MLQKLTFICLFLLCTSIYGQSVGLGNHIKSIKNEVEKSTATENNLVGIWLVVDVDMENLTKEQAAMMDMMKGAIVGEQLVFEFSSNGIVKTSSKSMPTTEGFYVFNGTSVTIIDNKTGKTEEMEIQFLSTTNLWIAMDMQGQKMIMKMVKLAFNPNKEEVVAPPVEEYTQKAESLPATTASFDNETFDFNIINEGDEVNHRFNFINTGNNDLVITNVKPSCGCLTPSWSQEPVKPGKRGYIDVKFNSAGKNGQQTKSITVTGNFEGDINKNLKLVGEVKGKK